MKKLFTFFVLVILAFDTLAIGPEVNPFLPQTERASEDDTEQCVRPECAYSITGFTEARVMITNNEEGATVIFDVYRDDKQIWKGSFKGEELTFDVEGEGNYVVHAIATKSGKSDSPDGGIFFLIWNGDDAVSELVNCKTVVGERYFNVAGQEMPQADGTTIVVTTFTDGSTTTTKVVK